MGLDRASRHETAILGSAGGGAGGVLAGGALGRVGSVGESSLTVGYPVQGVGIDEVDWRLEFVSAAGWLIGTQASRIDARVAGTPF